MIAFDTNVFVYALDTCELVKQSIAQELIDDSLQSGDEVVMLWQVACEILACLRRWEDSGRITNEELEEYALRYSLLFPLSMPSPDLLAESLRLHKRYSLSHWDSLLVAGCLKAGVETLYTEDLDSGTTYDSLTVVNPFAE